MPLRVETSFQLFQKGKVSIRQKSRQFTFSRMEWMDMRELCLLDYWEISKDGVGFLFSEKKKVTPFSPQLFSALYMGNVWENLRLFYHPRIPNVFYRIFLSLSL